MLRPDILRNIFFEDNPYDGFSTDGYTLDLQGWGSSSDMFRRVISTIRPNCIVEIGSWKGASAINMANIAKECGIDDFFIVCIDTWLGSHEHWLNRGDPTFFKSLNLKNGYPSIYYQFLANVVLSGHSDCIVPLPLPSISAFHYLNIMSQGKLKFDMIYVDAGHTYEEVNQDIRLYWPLLRWGGAMLGDDYNEGWPGIIRASNEFAEEQGEKLLVDDGKWLIQKLSSDRGVAGG